MKGEIGTLNRDGQQVGGFIDWEIQIDKIPELDGHTPAKTIGGAKAFWLFDRLVSGKYNAKFYRVSGDTLVLTSDVSVNADFPNCVSDKLIRHPMTFEFIW